MGLPNFSPGAQIPVELIFFPAALTLSHPPPPPCQMRKQDLANLAQTCRRFACLMRDDDVLWKEACRHRFDDSWLGRREWATSELANQKKPWRSRYRQTITTLRRWRTGRDRVHVHSFISFIHFFYSFIRPYLYLYLYLYTLPFREHFQPVCIRTSTTSTTTTTTATATATTSSGK